MPDKDLKTFRADVYQSQRAILERLSKDKSNIVAEFKDTMKNIVLTVIGIATAALIALSSTLVQVRWLMLIGVTILLVETIWIFAYLMYRQRKSVKKVLELKTSLLDPLNLVLSDYDNLVAGKITEGEFDGKLSPIFKNLKKEYDKSHNPFEANLEFETSFIDLVFLSMLGFATLCIILGLIGPYMFC